MKILPTWEFARTLHTTHTHTHTHTHAYLRGRFLTLILLVRIVIMYNLVHSASNMIKIIRLYRGVTRRRYKPLSLCDVGALRLSRLTINRESVCLLLHALRQQFATQSLNTSLYCARFTTTVCFTAPAHPLNSLYAQEAISPNIGGCTLFCLCVETTDTCILLCG
jgi:hypothetical protein